MAVTIKDVADAARVSTATVSHVLNETRYVSDETKAKVHDVIKRMGYVPNINAASLRANKTKRVGFLVPAIGAFFSVDIMKAVEEALRMGGYQLILGCTNEDIDVERDQVDIFNYQQIDGMIMFPAPGDHRYLDEMPRKYPIVFIDRSAEGCERDLFIGDNERATHDVTDLMIRAGRRRIGVIDGTHGISALDERKRGYKRALYENGLSFDETLVRDGFSTCDGGFAAAEWLIDGAGVDAIIALTASMSLGCMRYITQKGIPVPERVAVVSFGETGWAEITNPPLTTLRHPLYEMGKSAAERLLERIEEADSRRVTVSPYKTVRMPIQLMRRKTF